MKRAITVLILSLFAFPLFAQGPQSTKFQCVSLEHVQGAWRMQIKCEQGVGAISLSDSGQQKSFRGEGVFASWSQEKMKNIYESLVPKDSGPAFEVMQLG